LIIGKDLERSVIFYLKYYPGNYLEMLGKTRNTSCNIAGEPTGI
jgi:hypothetical protein